MNIQLWGLGAGLVPEVPKALRRAAGKEAGLCTVFPAGLREAQLHTRRSGPHPNHSLPGNTMRGPPWAALGSGWGL